MNLPPSFSVLPMTPSHIPAVANLESLCFSSPWSEALLLESLPLHSFWVALATEQNPPLFLEKGELLGYTSVHNVLGEGYINNVAVSPKVRQLGVGGALVDQMIAFGSNHLDFLSLEVRASNTSAISLYQSRLFQPIATRKNYYSNPTENALIMSYYFHKELQP